MLPDVRINFEKIIEYAKNKGGVSLNEKDIESIFEIGAYHGIFDEKNYGKHDRRNSVYLFLETLQALYEASDQEENQYDYQIFHVKINSGVEQQFKTKHTQYQYAAESALDNLEYQKNENGKYLVEIWVPRLLPTDGAYMYEFYRAV